jgi:antitoxin component YwqK of YwqJK toxin-antitoxin module
MDGCQICLEAKETRGEKIYRFCGGAHVFCETCFLDWKRIHDVQGKNTHCPTCRALVVVYVPRICRNSDGILAKTDGTHVERYPNGKKKSEYTILEGRLHGPYQMWFIDGKPFVETTYERGELHGTYHYWSDGSRKIRTCHYERGVLHGNFQVWDDKDGRLIKECTYLRGTLHGLFLEWHGGEGGRGIKARGIYQHGTLHGILQTWHDNGNRRSEEKMCEGILVTLQSWHPNGSLEKQFHEATGICEEWDEEGHLLKRYRRGGASGSGAYEGHYLEWYANGQKKIDCRYKEGRLHGTAEVWEADGTEKSYCFYEDGKLLF